MFQQFDLFLSKCLLSPSCSPPPLLVLPPPLLPLPFPPRMNRQTILADQIDLSHNWPRYAVDLHFCHLHHFPWP